MTARQPVAELVIVGVDPGGRVTGIVARHRDRLIAHDVIARDGRVNARTIADAGYAWRVLSGVEDAYHQASKLARQIAFNPVGLRLCVAVEGLTPPTPHRGMTNPAGTLAAAVVLGAVLGRWPGAVVVPPGGHGAGPLAAYPAELAGPGEKAGTGVLRHARSAWDVAGAAVTLLRVAEAAR